MTSILIYQLLQNYIHVNIIDLLGIADLIPPTSNHINFLEGKVMVEVHNFKTSFNIASDGQ